MTINDPIDAFVALLSHARSTTERSAKIYSELGELAENPDVKAALNARAFVQNGTLAKVDEAFKLIGKTPVEFPGKLTELMLRTFALNSPRSKHLRLSAFMYFQKRSRSHTGELVNGRRLSRRPMSPETTESVFCSKLVWQRT